MEWKQRTLAELQRDDVFRGFLMVRSGQAKWDSKGNPYLELNLMDRTGEINCMCWDRNAELPKRGDIVNVTGRLQWFNGRMQMKLENLRQKLEREDVDIQMLIPCAPEEAGVMMERVDEAVDSIKSKELQAIVRETIRMAGRKKLLYYPAAMRMHHAERSGLLHHMTDMLKVAEALCVCYPFLNRDLLISGVIVHDLAKILEMDSDEFGSVSDYTRDGLLIGHLVRGSTMIHQAAQNVGVKGEWPVLLEHMAISSHGRLEYGSPKPPMFPEAEVLHVIDDLDARMFEMKAIFERTPPGVFSEKIQSMEGKRVYHPFYKDEETRGRAKAVPDVEEVFS